MPVTKRHIVTESGSTRSAAGTCSVPTSILLKSLTVNSRSEWCTKRKNAMTLKTKLSATTVVPMMPMARSLSAVPLASTSRKPTSGNSRISVATGAISALQLVEFVDGGRISSTEDRHHDAESDGDFGRGDDHDEKDAGLSPDVAE